MLPALPAEKISARGPELAGGQQKSARAEQPTLPVREGEEPWTAVELDELRGRLEDEIADLKTEIAKAEVQIAENDSTDGAGDDQADVGAKTYEREHEMSLAYNSRDLLDQNERALARIEAGTYGTCESCGKPVGKARLQAFPRATLCVTCKQREERR
jgi:DnaK suppressor protein